MTEKHPESDGGHRAGDLRSHWERRKFLAIGGGVGATLFAGCTSDGGPGDDPDDGGDDGSDGADGESNFRLLVSDRPADIDDFDSLEVTFDSARVFQGGSEGSDDEDETEEDETETEEDPGAETDEDGDGGTPGAEDKTENEDGSEESDDGEDDDGEDDDGGSRGYVEFDLDGPTVDLTEVVGEKAMAVTEGHLEEGSYQKMELNVSDVEGIVDGEEAEVKVPSEKLQLTKPFEITAGETVDFVFDINVVKRGNEESYNLKPVIVKSGVVGQDVDEHEEVGDGDDGDDDEDETETEEDETETEEDETETEEDEATETEEPPETEEPTETEGSTETASD